MLKISSFYLYFHSKFYLNRIVFQVIKQALRFSIFSIHYTLFFLRCQEKSEILTGLPHKNFIETINEQIHQPIQNIALNIN
jgi:hypothetical protein